MDKKLPPTHMMEVRISNSGRAYYRDKWGAWAGLMRDVHYDKALRDKNIKKSTLKEF